MTFHSTTVNLHILFYYSVSSLPASPPPSITTALRIHSSSDFVIRTAVVRCTSTVGLRFTATSVLVTLSDECPITSPGGCVCALVCFIHFFPYVHIRSMRMISCDTFFHPFNSHYQVIKEKEKDVYVIREGEHQMVASNPKLTEINGFAPTNEQWKSRTL